MLGDIVTATQDRDNAIVAAKKMGIPEEEIHVFSGLDSREMNKMIRRESHRYSAFAYEGKKVFIFTYCSGHGVEQN